VAGGEPEEIAVRLVSASYFATLGVPTIQGSSFDPSREPAPGAAPYAVLSYDYWQRRLGRRADVLGRTIAFRGGTVSVLGVAPRSFFGETVGEQPDVWVPLAMQWAVLPGRDWLRDAPGSVEKFMWLHVFVAGGFVQSFSLELGSATVIRERSAEIMGTPPRAYRRVFAVRQGPTRVTGGYDDNAIAIASSNEKALPSSETLAASRSPRARRAEPI
jgi:hypothetical protein